MNIDDVMTHISHPEDLPFLKTKLFDVNMRLFKVNHRYRCIIKHCCMALRRAARINYDDYKKPHGVSGANLAIPFNIIGIVRNRGEKNEYCEIMINPKITKYFGKERWGKSNCGSIRLKEPIYVARPEWIDLEWFDEKGEKQRKEGIGIAEGSFTIQHEVDHNLGILITDRAK